MSVDGNEPERPTFPPVEAAASAPYTSLRQSANEGRRATVLGILASSVLAAIKVLSGVFGNSYALIADGIESILDILSSLIVWGSLRLASSPPNERYPFGYGKVEPLSALVVAVALLAAASGITIQSVREILTPHHLPEPFTLGVLVLVVIAKETMYRSLHAVGRRIQSGAMQTDAWHHRSDSLTSLAAFLGISIALIGGKGYESADDWAALFASSIIAFNGVRLFSGAWSEVLDISPSPTVVARVREIAAGVMGVRAIDKCRVRKSGLGLFVDIHVVVDGQITVHKGHAIGHDVQSSLTSSDLAIVDVVVHIEPHELPPREALDRYIPR